MLESIRSLDDIPLTDDVWFTREDRIAVRDRRLLMQQARDRAKAFVAQAQQEAEMIRTHAFQEGYSQGVVRAAEDLSQLLLDSRALATALQAELLSAMRELLGDCLRDSDLVEAVLTGWLERLGECQSVLQVVLPLRCKREQTALKASLKNMGMVALDVHFHDQERYMFRMADQVLVLDIGATQERLSPRLMSQLKSLPDSVRQLDEKTQQFLVKWASRLVEGGQVPNDGLEVEQPDE